MTNNDKIMANRIVPIIVTIFNKFNININLDCEIAKNMTIDQNNIKTESSSKKHNDQDKSQEKNEKSERSKKVESK